MKKKSFICQSLSSKKLVFLLVKQNNNSYHGGRTSDGANPKKCKMIVTILVDYNYQTNISNSQVFLYVTELIR